MPTSPFTANVAVPGTYTSAESNYHTPYLFSSSANSPERAP